MVEPADWLLTRVERGSNPRTRVDELHGDRAWSEGNHAVRGSAARRTSAVHGAIEATGPGDLVVFPDEPYAFTPDDGPEAWPQCRPVFVSGRHLTWYGPSLVEAPELLVRQLGG